MEQSEKQYELSVPAAAVLLLFWQAPTDRALAGWLPWGFLPEAMSGDGLVHWLRDQMKISLAETHDQARLTC